MELRMIVKLHRQPRGVVELTMDVVEILPSQEELILDLGGLWYVMGKGVMIVEMMNGKSRGMRELILRVMTKMKPSQKKLMTGRVGVW